jgi:predicted N-formylglutamate amidohydrolase
MPDSALLAPDETPLQRHGAGAGAGRVLLVCDHASNRVPRALGHLGLDDALLARHIGWDIGAADVTRALSDRLGTPALLAGFSRLVIDCNREPEDSSSIPAASDGIAIPGNRGLAADVRRARHDRIFAPYHAAIAGWIDAGLARGETPMLLSIHSFTPSLGGTQRPWHVGILWDGDGRIAVPLLTALRGEAALMVGDNQPYSARQPAGYTMRHHGLARRLPHVAVELRQDLIGDVAGVGEWVARLATALVPILADAALYRLWQK